MSVEFEELAKLRENAGDEGQSKNSLYSMKLSGFCYKILQDSLLIFNAE